jgi:hypothetical protein
VKRSILILVALWCMLVIVGGMHSYGDVTTQNAGLWWNIPFTHHWCGVEYRGTPGFFCDVT